MKMKFSQILTKFLNNVSSYVYTLADNTALIRNNSLPFL